MPAVQLFEKILKRDGTTETFDRKKITQAIAKAGRATGEFDERMAETLSLRVVNIAHQMVESPTPSVENIQDIVEDVLLTSPFKKTAKAYILYREQHKQIREVASRFNAGLVGQYLARSDWRVKENSNMAFSLQGLNHFIASEVSQIYWLNTIYPEKIKQAHQEGAMHIHDLGLISVYCVGWDLQDLLISGFQGAVGKMESRPARHLRSALGQIVNFFYTLQGEAAGAQAFSNFDTLLAPFIRVDGLSYAEVKQALQEFIFNVNVPTRVGFQTPFTNITLDLTVPSTFRDRGIIIGGEIQSATYKEFQPEMDLFNRVFLEVMQEGDARGRVFTFPIPTVNITKEFDWDNPNLEGLWRITAKYGVPYFSNFIHSEMSPDDARSMCCRLRLDNRELRRRGGGLFGASPLTGSIGVVTLNLPRLAYLSHNREDFLSRLDHLMDLAKESLEIKRNVLEKFTAQGLYPYIQFYLRDIQKRFGQYWKNHFSTLGLIGMNEACLNLLGQGIDSPAGRSWALSVLSHMRERILGYQEETGNHYNLEATPAEGTSYRLARLDKQQHPEIICANERDVRQGKEPFYTNSTHLPVDYTRDIFEALDHQDDFQVLYTGGTVLHGFVGEKIDDPESVKRLVRVICETYRLPYFTLTPTFSVCPEDGYQAGEHFHCPQCGRECEVYSRVVGYLRPVQQWNAGKQEEFKDRTPYVVGKRICV